ncbi:MAG: glutaredoxin family protein [Halioglobus sp.]
MTERKSGAAGGYILFGTSACHLCELAEELLQGCPELVFEKVDISDSDLLFERYGVRIPVIKAPGGSELGWPFDAAQLNIFLVQSS